MLSPNFSKFVLIMRLKFYILCKMNTKYVNSSQLNSIENKNSNIFSNKHILTFMLPFKNFSKPRGK